MADTDVVEDEATESAPAPASFLDDALVELRERLPDANQIREQWVGWSIGSGLALFLIWTFFAADINPVQVVAIGVQVGAVFSLIGLGLVLVYKATRVLNFAQGELGTVPAFLAFSIMVGFQTDLGAQPDKSDLWWASAVAVVAGAVLALLINLLVVQRLADASPVTALVATAGVFLFFVSLEVIVFEASSRPFPRYIDGTAFALAGQNISWHTVLVVLVLAGAATALAIFFRTPPGIALLATAQEPFAAELSGVSVRAMSALAWGAAGALGAIGGLLGAGVFENLTPGLITAQFLIPAFVGAVLGGLTSMIGAVVGGILVGLVTTYSNELVLGFELDIPGPPQVATLLILLGVLLLRPRGLFGKEA